MAGMKLQLDIKDWKKLEKFYKRAPKAASHASAAVLNSFAFGTREEILKTINRKFTVRKPQFVKSVIKVQKARGGGALTGITAVVGSIFRKRFSGWQEQEFGVRTTRNRLITLMGREKSWISVLKAKHKLSPGKQYPKPEDFPGKDQHTRVVVMLQVLGRQSGGKPFIIRGHKRLKAGLWKFRGRKLRRLQTTNPNSVQPRRRQWLRPATKKFMANKADIRRAWAAAIEFQLNRIK